MKELDKLGDLYTATGHDWVLEISHILTEPTCPTVIIRPEGAEITRYRVDTGSIEKGIQIAADMVHREVVLRERVGHAAPFTEGHDQLYAEWLERRLAGSDDPLPQFRQDNRWGRETADPS